MSNVLDPDIGIVRPNPFRRLWEVYIPTKIAEQGLEAVRKYYQDRRQKFQEIVDRFDQI